MMPSEIEVELKLPSPDPDRVRLKLHEIGAEETKSQLQYDLYLDRPVSSFADTDEALRLRRRLPFTSTTDEISALSGPGEITYKGPKLDDLSKTRVEHTIPVESVQQVLLLFEHLGFKHVLTVKKRRVYYEIDEIVISIDEVADLGTYVELEIVVTSEDKIASNRERLFKKAREIGLNPEDSIMKSYLELLLSSKSV